MKRDLLNLVPSALATSILIVMLANMQAQPVGAGESDPAPTASTARVIEPACGRVQPGGADRCL